MLQFSDFDSRDYRSVEVPTGYGEWVAAYERTVEVAMEVALLDALTTPPWRTLRCAADLGCGTGRFEHLESLGVTLEESEPVGTDLSLAEVAAHAGFADQSQLCHHFKRRLGVTPGRFRMSARIA